METTKLQNIAQALVARSKGILAADESDRTIKKRFDGIGVESTIDNRRSYREMLFTTPGIEAFLSGVILFDETFRQSSQAGIPFYKLLADKGILPGIKVDKGTVPLPDSPDETITAGLDGLSERLAEYYNLGAKFAKWRAVITIKDDKLPTLAALEANADIMAQYASFCQGAGVVPIVEPEVLLDGNHSLERCAAVSEATLAALFSKLQEHKVYLPDILLKTSMVLPGKEFGDKAAPEKIAAATLSCFRKVIPNDLPGIVFLSGGQGPVEATANLQAINSAGQGVPWQLSYSFARALQGEALEAWKGQAANLPRAQKIFYHRAQCVSAARDGQYSPAMENSL